MEMKPTIIGRYNELEYTVDLYSDEEVMGLELYRAGNSEFDSQGYTTSENGVGLETMRRYCEQTTRDIAKDHKVKYGGIEYLEID
jgi:hypothetical protein